MLLRPPPPPPAGSRPPRTNRRQSAPSQYQQLPAGKQKEQAVASNQRESLSTNPFDDFMKSEDNCHNRKTSLQPEQLDPFGDLFADASSGPNAVAPPSNLLDVLFGDVTGTTSTGNNIVSAKTVEPSLAEKDASSTDDFLDIFGFPKDNSLEPHKQDASRSPSRSSLTSSDNQDDEDILKGVREWTMSEILNVNSPRASISAVVSPKRKSLQPTSDNQLEEHLSDEADNVTEEHGIESAEAVANVRRGFSVADESGTSGNLFKVEPQQLKQVLSSPVPAKAGRVKCYLVSNSAGYSLYTEEDNRFLLAAKRASKLTSVTPAYHLSMKMDEFAPESSGYLGRLSGNLVGSDYNLYDSGQAPEKAVGILTMRKQLAGIQYATTRMQGVPRQMQVCIPAVQEEDKVHVWRPKSKKDYMQALLLEGKSENLSVLINKTPVWNETLESYCLDFGGRVTKACVANFLLVEPDDASDILMLFGQVGPSRYTCDFCYPISPLQAFGIALSAVNSKLVCE